MNAVVKWPGFKYEPIPEVVIRLQFRELQKERVNMMRFFLERGHYDYATQLYNLKRNPRLNAREKRERFAAILQDYAHATTRGETPPPAPEAPPSPPLGDVGLPSV